MSTTPENDVSQQPQSDAQHQSQQASEQSHDPSKYQLLQLNVSHQATSRSQQVMLANAQTLDTESHDCPRQEIMSNSARQAILAGANTRNAILANAQKSQRFATQDGATSRRKNGFVSPTDTSMIPISHNTTDPMMSRNNGPPPHRVLLLQNQYNRNNSPQRAQHNNALTSYRNAPSSQQVQHQHNKRNNPQQVHDNNATMPRNGPPSFQQAQNYQQSNAGNPTHTKRQRTSFGSDGVVPMPLSTPTAFPRMVAQPPQRVPPSQQQQPPNYSSNNTPALTSPMQQMVALQQQQALHRNAPVGYSPPQQQQQTMPDRDSFHPPANYTNTSTITSIRALPNNTHGISSTNYVDLSIDTTPHQENDDEDEGQGDLDGVCI